MKGRAGGRRRGRNSLTERERREAGSSKSGHQVQTTRLSFPAFECGGEKMVSRRRAKQYVSIRPGRRAEGGELGERVARVWVSWRGWKAVGRGCGAGGSAGIGRLVGQEFRGKTLQHLSYLKICGYNSTPAACVLFRRSWMG